MTERLSSLVGGGAAITVPGAPNGMFARVIEDLGFEAVYVTGAGVANMHLGAPDIGLTTLTELANAVSGIVDAVSIPVIVDADTGFGNAVNTYRTIRVLERGGAAGIQLEDQVFPKRCGHFTGKEVIAADEMVQKIKAATDARVDEKLQIIARTDALALYGVEHAIERAALYIEAGADLTFVEAPTTLKELETIGRELGVPQVVNIVIGGKTPDPGRERLSAMGFSIVLHANAALHAALKAANTVLKTLKEEGSLESASRHLATFDERQQTVSKPFWDSLSATYQTGPDGSQSMLDAG